MRNYKLNLFKDDISTWTRFTKIEDTLVSLDDQLAIHGLEIVFGFQEKVEAVYVKIEPRKN